MKTFIQLENKPDRALPEKSNQTTSAIPKTSSNIFSTNSQKKGIQFSIHLPGSALPWLSLSPWSGLHTALNTTKTGFNHIQSLLKYPDRLIHGNSVKLNSYDLHQFDFCLTSPPYMSEKDEENPFAAYSEPSQGYTQYLTDITTVYRQISQLMKPGGKAIIEVSNVKQPRGVTTLAWDMGKTIGTALKFEGEIVIGWNPTYGMGYDHSYALVYSKPIN
jgi:hypothetical protein